MHTAIKLLNFIRKINNFKEGCFVISSNVRLFKGSFCSTKKGQIEIYPSRLSFGILSIAKSPFLFQNRHTVFG